MGFSPKYKTFALLVKCSRQLDGALGSLSSGSWQEPVFSGLNGFSICLETDTTVERVGIKPLTSWPRDNKAMMTPLRPNQHHLGGFAEDILSQFHCYRELSGRIVFVETPMKSNTFSKLAAKNSCYKDDQH